MLLPSIGLGDAPCTLSTEPLDRVMDLGYRNLEFVVEDGVEVLPGKLIDRCLEFCGCERGTEHTFDHLMAV